MNGYPNPSNGVMASRKNGILMKLTLEKLNNKLLIENKLLIDNKNNKLNFEYFDLGKIIIWESLKELKKNNYDYYHYPSEYDGTRDKLGNWVHTPNHFNNKHTELLDINKTFFIMLANNEISNYPEYKWVHDCNKQNLLNGDKWISYLFRKSLNV